MSRIVFAIGIVAALTNFKAESTANCHRLAHYGGLRCCLRDVPRAPPTHEVKKCLQITKQTESCEFHTCLAKNHGFILEDGTFDRTKMANEIDELFENDFDLADTIKENCIRGNLSKYGPAFFCEFKKMSICMEVQVIMTCDQWDDEGDCNGMKETVAECVQKYL